MSAQWKQRRSRAQSVAEEAWDHAASVLQGARAFSGTVRDRASDLAGEASERYGAAYHTASDRVGSASAEARKRAGLALDALSGRKPRKPWGWIAVAVLGGVAVGWAVAASAPRVIRAAADRFAAEPGEPDTFPATAGLPAPDEPVPWRAEARHGQIADEF
ncbi:hypothetical protein ABT297_18745 [Dactylosporangium sp. NPDC000555]|uniref:hypothetical protein n=1 Tax=Dactylosporangium sp. NPDC000555 TaxID=3154260 RepID=UPI003333EB79